MISGLADSVLVTFIVFCRIGACLMLVPGYSSVNVPAQVRLFVALVTTFALTPILVAVLKPLTDNAAPLTLALLICSELVVGSVIGLGGRVFFLALQTMATVMASAIGLSNIPGTPIGDTDPAPALVPADHDGRHNAVLHNRPALAGPARVDELLRRLASRR
ncbi:flagellar biosynthesis protein FliR [Bradyrhizobium sp. LB13.1]